MKIASIVLIPGVLACASVQLVSATETAKVKDKVVHSFGSGTDGQRPLADLTDVKGTLYGTTYAGGAFNSGAIFALDPKTGAETVTYSFCSQQNCPDGQEPEGGLIDVKGALYGTTNAGGTSGDGVLFALDLSTGAETVLYSFCAQQNCTDGASPYGTLTDVNGILYGTTARGGVNGYYTGGTVFAFDPNTGMENVLYSFCSQQNCTDGQGPNAGVINVKGTLYGTTGGGGSTGNGTVYSLDPKSGAENVLYSFCTQQNCADGGFPYAALTNVKGTLFSTTVYGGAYNGGTVFTLDPSTGAETVVHSFGNYPDGRFPYANLIDVKGTLYSTTLGGGENSCTQYGGCGTVFSVNPNTGNVKVVYSFCSQEDCVDGEQPVAEVIAVKGKLFGTTDIGGEYGYGTVFSLKR